MHGRALRTSLALFGLLSSSHALSAKTLEGDPTVLAQPAPAASGAFPDLPAPTPTPPPTPASAPAPDPVTEPAEPPPSIAPLPRSETPARPVQRFPSERPSEHADMQFDLHAGLGFAGGGANLITATYVDGSSSSIDAGAGLVFAGGVTWMPFWFGDTLGMGVAVDVGWKHKSLYVNSDGNATMNRYPITASVQGLLDLGKSWYLAAGAGIDYETGIRFRGEGVLADFNADFDDAVGGLGELGILWKMSDLAFDFRVRYTAIHYSAFGQQVDASNVSGVLGMRYYP
jgi:hypothetical protein